VATLRFHLVLPGDPRKWDLMKEISYSTGSATPATPATPIFKVLGIFFLREGGAAIHGVGNLVFVAGVAGRPMGIGMVNLCGGAIGFVFVGQLRVARVDLGCGAG